MSMNYCQVSKILKSMKLFNCKYFCFEYGNSMAPKEVFPPSFLSKHIMLFTVLLLQILTVLALSENLFLHLLFKCHEIVVVVIVVIVLYF